MLQAYNSNVENLIIVLLLSVAYYYVNNSSSHRNYTKAGHNAE